MTDVDYQKARAHLLRKVKNWKCPVCDERRWEIVGVVAPPVMEQILIPGFSTSVLPLVVVRCRNCFYARHFAWKLIETEAEGGHG